MRVNGLWVRVYIFCIFSDGVMDGRPCIRAGSTQKTCVDYGLDNGTPTTCTPTQCSSELALPRHVESCCGNFPMYAMSSRLGTSHDLASLQSHAMGDTLLTPGQRGWVWVDSDRKEFGGGVNLEFQILSMHWERQMYSCPYLFNCSLKMGRYELE